MQLSTTMGMELTYIPTFLQAAADENISEWVLNDLEIDLLELKVDVFKKALKNKGILKNFTTVYTDPGVVEAPTKPFLDSDELLHLVRQTHAVAKQVGLSPKLDYSTGGGAHIHMGLPHGRNSSELRENYRTELLNLVSKYPVS